MIKKSIAVTRAANSCVLLELNGHAVLTDPWFTERWWLRRGEPLGLRIADLPPLAAVVVTNLATNHWDLRALRMLAGKDVTPVYVPTSGMARRARALGFRHAQRVRWGETREIAPGVLMRVVPAGRTLVWPNNAYSFSTAGSRVFFGGEIAEVAPLERHRAGNPPVDVALLPVNGLRPLLGPRLVMGPDQAVAGASVLGARVLVPVHDAHGRDPLSALFRTTGTASDATALAGPDLNVVDLPTGRRWEPTP
ncbi:L-ascorbate metabolism protein UlaG (beta-lactamase superfamily) [Nonomuraea muscovyensis]|uniref:L-ascorbate metabolism protein UlaG (Beta-lactamase superfamily) n=1 Tax=Nonomuraea muscovyensis TaxID=1124761 RepID=A0A7X0C446_9ACTN|nr:MBL fold metallo-hydrolase [Nonomuraea muscovyensis]MBB6346706.1 L-ascorbate metabolism protein UlaG (beta-lactamase superfamily) [Nonomuraea muscovyensis]